MKNEQIESSSEKSHTSHVIEDLGTAIQALIQQLRNKAPLQQAG